MEQDTQNPNTTLSLMPQEAFYIHPDIEYAEVFPPVMQNNRNERLKLAIDNMRIGQRIHDELKSQGRSVTWLAQQLCVERTTLYYTFRQNSINAEFLLRISFFLNHNFLQDVADLYKEFGL